MAKVEYREYRPEDAESFLRLHDSVFPRMSPEYWANWSRGQVTAAVAISDGEVVGAVPLQFRDFLIRPGLSVPVAWEYSVCTREDLRGTGVGSRLMAVAAEFLRGRCQAMMVYREDERSRAYHFYRRTGHEDLAYLTTWVREPAPVWPSERVRRIAYADFLAHEERAVDLFRSAHGNRGGYPPRFCGYYEVAVQTPQYHEVPLDLSVLLVPAEGSMRGYAIVGEERLVPALHLLEVVAEGNELRLAFPLLAAYAELASERGVSAHARLADGSPYAPVLQALGFRPRPRSRGGMMILGRLLDPEGLAEAAWRPSEATQGLEVTVWTPGREVILHRASGEGTRRVVLEMKESGLARLLLGRLDLTAALDMGLVTAPGASGADLAAVADALPWAPWAYHQLDYV